MSKLVECVPNFSDGRDKAVLAELERAITGVAGVRLLDIQADASHHRSVFTFIGAPEAAAEAAFQAMAVAARRIDLTTHKGEHPRMGATDVVPFIPVANTTMDECVALAQALGARVGTELGIPVYLYARAASRPDRESLPAIRKGEFEGLRQAIGTDHAKAPDFGPAHIHPTAGATAIGARPFLVAYNIYLETSDVALAERIAKEIRTSSGGLPALQAKGFDVSGRAQVSMNLLDIDVTSPAIVFDLVRDKAQLAGVAVHASELVGLIPERAVLDAAEHYLKLPDVTPHLLEARVRAAQGPTLDGWIDELAGPSPTPGGGSAAALAGALAAALAAMVARLTVGRKAYASVASEFTDMIVEGERLRASLRRLVDEDAAAYGQVSAAYKLPKASAAEQGRRIAAIDAALLGAAAVPLETARQAAAVARLARRAAQAGNRNAVSDAATAALLAETAATAAAYNVEVNVKALSDPANGQNLLVEARSLVAAASEAAEGAEAAVLEELKK
ncbi:MAG TPA: glutamate formimidoyltransferase [Gemmatimonadales bacterium]|jgi:glutamate formiminotransferase/formiminotetrahydrofolate cyclodeaminase